MAVFRKIETSFWQDPFILDLEPEEKYFYLYLMTNTKTSQCGIYEISKAIMQMELGLDRKKIDLMINKFITYGKILYSEDTHEIMILNWLKYNKSTSPKVLKKIESELKEIKNTSLAIKYLEFAKSENICIDTVSIPYLYCIDTKSQEEEEEEEEEDEEEEEEKEKEKEKEEEKKGRSLKIDEDLKLIAHEYERCGFGTIDFTTKELLEELLEQYSTEWIVQAFKICVDANKRTLKYTKGILNNWKIEGGMKLGGGSNGTANTRNSESDNEDEIDWAKRAGIKSL